MIFYTDGSCTNNGHYPNIGGYGIVAFDDKESCVIDAWSAQEKNSTNNREEMKALLFVMENFGIGEPSPWDEREVPVVFTDSFYAQNTFTNWMFGWYHNGWIKSDGNPPENLDIVQKFFELYMNGRRVNIKRIKGHSGILGNELADQLATGKITPQEVLSKYGRK